MPLLLEAFGSAGALVDSEIVKDDDAPFDKVGASWVSIHVSKAVRLIGFSITQGVVRP